MSDAELAAFGSMSPGGSSRDLGGAGDEKKKRARARASTNFRGKSMQEAMDEANRENATCQQCDESQVSFPTNLEGYFPVLDPYSSNRLVWDFSMLVLIMVITIVTPFELTFLEVTAIRSRAELSSAAATQPSSSASCSALPRAPADLRAVHRIAVGSARAVASHRLVASRRANLSHNTAWPTRPKQ